MTADPMFDTVIRRPRRWLWPATIAAVVVLAAAGWITWTKLASSTVTITGTVSVDPDPGHVPCSASLGTGDIRAGAPVVVSNAAGTTVAVGELQQGLVVGPDSAGGYTCSYAFTVKAPGGSDFYGVEVSHRGRLQYPRAALDTPLALKLG